MTRDRARDTLESTSCTGQIGPVSDALVETTSSRGGLGLGFDGLRGLPAIPGNAGTCPRDCRNVSRDCRVYQLSRATHARALARGPAGSTSRPCDLGPHPRARGVYQQSWENQTSAGGPTVSRSCPGRLASSWCVRSLGVDQLYRVTRAWVCGPSASTSCTRQLGSMSPSPQV